MARFSISCRYTYIHECEQLGGPIGIHHVLTNRNRITGFRACLLSLFFLMLSASSLYFLFGKDSSVVIVSSSCILGGFFVMSLSRKSIKKDGSESVIIMPAFGVQLETHYSSGRTISRFIPIDKILKPVLVECVTPVTCYWSLSLILRGEEELTLVFKELCPPIKMLIPIWKALCNTIDTGQKAGTSEEDASS